jgi:hypothetical protein
MMRAFKRTTPELNGGGHGFFGPNLVAEERIPKHKLDLRAEGYPAFPASELASF